MWYLAAYRAGASEAGDGRLWIVAQAHVLHVLCGSDEHLHSRQQAPGHVRLCGKTFPLGHRQEEEHEQLVGIGTALFMSLQMIALELLSALHLGLLVGSSRPEGWSRWRRH